jgi:ParB-like chromosome segregation protein Spo0J
MLELALIENIQRKDLTPFEESEAMQGLAQKFGYTTRTWPSAWASRARPLPRHCR